MTKKNSWTLTGFAFTREPGTRQRGNEITIIEKDGEEWFRVPLLKAARIKHGKNIFEFTKEDLGDIYSNWKSKTTDFVPYGRVGHEKNPALAELEEPNGYLEIEDNYLVAYAKPLSEEDKEVVTKKRYTYASVDMVKNYQSAELAALEAPDNAKITFSINNEIEEEQMTVIELEKAEYEELVASKAKAETQAAEIAKLEDSVKQLQAKLEAIEADAVVEEPEVDSKTLALLEANQKLQQKYAKIKLENVFVKAEKVAAEKGANLPAVARKVFGSLIAFGKVELQDGEVKLEAPANTEVSTIQEWILDWVDVALETLPLYQERKEETVVLENKTAQTVNGFTQEDWDKIVKAEIEKVEVK